MKGQFSPQLVVPMELGNFRLRQKDCLWNLAGGQPVTH
jgi:hypothetical protein